MSGPRQDLVAAATAWRDLDPDPATRDAMDALLRAGDPAALADHVGRRVAFGTAGLRAARGPGPNRMNRLVVRQAAAGLARTLADLVPTATERGVVVGRDARHGSAAFAADVAEVLTAHGIVVHAFDEAVPTPLVAFACARLAAAAGVVITASHNPAGDNGMKVYWQDGAQIVAPVDAAIAAAIDVVAQEMAAAPTDAGAVLLPTGPTAPRHGLGGSLTGDLSEAYVEAALALVDPLPGPPVRIAATPLHGVGGPLLERVLSAAGHQDLHVVATAARPRPRLRRRSGSPTPRSPAHWTCCSTWPVTSTPTSRWPTIPMPTAWPWPCRTATGSGPR